MIELDRNMNMNMNMLSSDLDTSLGEENFDLATYVIGDSKSDFEYPVKMLKSIKNTPFPYNHVGPPARGDFDGICEFDVSLSSYTTDKKKYVYSHILNKVFLCMNTEMAVQFRWKWDTIKDEKLLIRATLILSDIDHQETRILRCHEHRIPSCESNKDVKEDILIHILRSARQTEDVMYCGDEETENKWLSVATIVDNMPPKGVDAFHHVYKFCCKHSCTSGINRRRLEVLYTLENSKGEIYGRKSLGIRVCGSPRRDMKKEEDEFHLKGNGDLPTKKRKIAIHNRNSLDDINLVTSNDSDTYLINIQIPGFDNYKFCLQRTYDYIAGEIIKIPTSDPAHATYEEQLREINKILRETTLVK